MMSSTLGAPFGGTTRGGHQGVDSEAFSLITPPKLGSGGGICFPSIVVVAPGEPGVPVICWAIAFGASDTHKRMLDDNRPLVILLTTSSCIGQFRDIPRLSRRLMRDHFAGLCIFRHAATDLHGRKLPLRAVPWQKTARAVEPRMPALREPHFDTDQTCASE